MQTQAANNLRVNQIASSTAIVYARTIPPVLPLHTTLQLGVLVLAILFFVLAITVRILHQVARQIVEIWIIAWETGRLKEQTTGRAWPLC